MEISHTISRGAHFIVGNGSDLASPNGFVNGRQAFADIASHTDVMLPIRMRITARQRRSFVTSLFGFTFLASVITVSASTILPCPARKDRARWAESDKEGIAGYQTVEVVKRPRRWIEETTPEPRTPNRKT